MATTNTRIVIRRDLALTWETVNPELLTGEQGFETDTGKFKIGEGKTWNATGYAAYLPSEVDAKVDDEATVRAATDSDLQTDLNGAKARIEVLEADATTKTYVDEQVAAEAVLREDADTAEAAAREAADTTLQGNIDTVDGRVDAEITARGLAFDALEADIQTNAGAIVTEASTREATDDALDARIDNVQGNLDAEVTSREGADTALSGRLDVLEADPTTATAVEAVAGDLADVVDGTTPVASATEAGKVSYMSYSPSNGDPQPDVVDGGFLVELDNKTVFIGVIDTWRALN